MCSHNWSCKSATPTVSRGPSAHPPFETADNARADRSLPAWGCAAGPSGEQRQPARELPPLKRTSRFPKLLRVGREPNVKLLEQGWSTIVRQEKLSRRENEPLPGEAGNDFLTQSIFRRCDFGQARSPSHCKLPNVGTGQLLPPGGLLSQCPIHTVSHRRRESRDPPIRRVVYTNCLSNRAVLIRLSVTCRQAI
jgi:hypothetical protein